MRPLVLLSALILPLMSTLAHAAPSSIAYTGTYTGGASQGIYAFRVERAADGSPRFAPLGLAAATASPSFLAIEAKRHLVFAVNETAEFNGEATGAVSAFAADPATGKLTLLNQQPSRGKHPCHLALDPSGKFLVVANYSSGTVAVFPVAADGRLGAVSCVVQHTGHGPDAKRQEQAHAHCVTFDPAGKFVFVCDLGLDRIVAYRLDDTGKLHEVTDGGGKVRPGSGPRHLAFGANGRFAYALNELTATVTTFAYEASTGRLTELQTLAALPADFSGAKSGAEIAVHPGGRWLYTSNRGHDSIACFAIDPATGTLTFEGTQPAGGKTPRNFAILPDGEHLVAANQDTASLQLFAIDGKSGKLTPSGEPIATPKPVCVEFWVQ